MSLPVLRRYLTETEQQQLLRAARTTHCPLAQRDYWWMRLLIETGARIDEFASWSAAQAEAALRSGWLVSLPSQRKGKKRGQEYLVTQTVRECLVQLLRLSREQQPAGAALEGVTQPLVWGREAAPLSVRSYQARLAHWAQQAGLPFHVSPHWLRHTRGVNIIRRSRAANPLKVAQAALGHVSVASTGVYTGMLREEYEAALRNVDGARMPKHLARREALAQPGRAAR